MRNGGLRDTEKADWFFSLISDGNFVRVKSEVNALMLTWINSPHAVM